jgi:hypothetical protein
VWFTALPFQTEARYGLPAKTLAIVAAFAGFSALRRAPSRGVNS